MNETANGTPPWAQYLRALPDAEPPAALRARVLGPQRRGGARRWAGLALAATAAGVALLLPLLQRGGPSESADALAAAQALEQRMLASDSARDPRVQAGVAEIDRALSDAYRRQARPEEIEALWRARVHTLERALTAAPAEPARI